MCGRHRVVPVLGVVGRVCGVVASLVELASVARVRIVLCRVQLLGGPGHRP